MKRRSMILVAILFLAIGFATVTTNLIINGNLLIGNNDDFVVIFTSAKLNGANRSRFISPDKKTITFETNTLTTMKDVETLEFEVTNTSRNYNANVVITCTPVEHEYVELTLPSEMTVSAGTSEKERIIARLKKVTSEEQKIEINCTLTATAEERDNLGNEYVAPFSKAGTMMSTTVKSFQPVGAFWDYSSQITKVVFENKMKPYETSKELVFDVSENQDESVMAYLVTNENAKYTLYIQSETGVKANEDSKYLFAEFDYLTSIEGLEYLDTSNVTNMESMFMDCVRLTTLDVSNFDTSNVTTMEYMFCNCSSLTTLDLSNFDTSNVTTMDSMFDYCEKLTTLYLSSFDTSNVTNMDGMFCGCRSLTTLDLSNFDTSNVTTMSWMFADCSSLTTLDLSSFDTSKVKYMDSMFKACSNLINMYLGRIDINNNAITGKMFENTSSNMKVHIKDNATKEWILEINSSYTDHNFILET